MPFFGSSRVRESLSAMRSGADELRGFPVDIWPDDFRVNIGGRSLTLSHRIDNRQFDVIFSSFDPPALPMREYVFPAVAEGTLFEDPWEDTGSPW